MGDHSCFTQPSLYTLDICGNNGGDRPRVISVLSAILDRVVQFNDQKCSMSSNCGIPKLTVFHGLRAPTITIEKYLERIYKYANCSPSCFVVAYILLDRIVQRQPDMPITSLNVHRLLITSVMAAAKFQDDAYFNNAYYAKVGGVTTGEINRLELEFLFRVDFRLNVTTELFVSYCKLMEAELWRTQSPLPQLPPQIDGSSWIMKKQYVTASKSCGQPAMAMETEVSDPCSVTTPPRDCEIQRPPSQLSRVSSFTP